MVQRARQSCAIAYKTPLLLCSDRLHPRRDCAIASAVPRAAHLQQGIRKGDDGLPCVMPGCCLVENQRCVDEARAVDNTRREHRLCRPIPSAARSGTQERSRTGAKRRQHKTRVGANWGIIERLHINLLNLCLLTIVYEYTISYRIDHL
jgi:hypothetical protein